MAIDRTDRSDGSDGDQGDEAGAETGVMEMKVTGVM